jgi:hypothetical protein
VTGAVAGPTVPYNVGPASAAPVARFAHTIGLSKAEAFQLCDVMWRLERRLGELGYFDDARAAARWIEIVEERLVQSKPNVPSGSVTW